MYLNPWRGIGKQPLSVWIIFGATLINRSGTMALPYLILYLTRKLGYGHRPRA